MYFWISALLATLLSFGTTSPDPNFALGTVQATGPVFLNGTPITRAEVLAEGDRLETGPGGIASLSLSSTDRMTLGEHSVMRLARSGDGVSAAVDSGRLQVNSSHLRLREVRLTDEGISINAVPGSPREYMVTRMANASYVVARHGDVTITDEGYGSSKEVPEGMVGALRTERVHIDPPLPQQRPTPGPTQVSTAGAGRRAGTITALIPADYIHRGGTQMDAAKDTVINLQDEVESKDHGRVRMVLDDGSILNLGSKSKMTIREHDATTQRTDVELTYGRVRAQVAKLGRPDTQWQVRTSTAICGVLGTDFYVETDGNKTKLVVLEGRVSFTAIKAGVVAAAVSAVTVVAGQASTSAGGAVAAPAASGAASSTTATTSTSIGSQASSLGTTVASTAVTRIAIVTAVAAPAAATAVVVAANQTPAADQTSVISQFKP